MEPWLRALTPGQALLVAGIENVVIFALAVGLGEALDRWRGRRPQSGEVATGRLAWGLAICTVSLNALVTFAGWRFWCAGWIRIRPAGWLGSLLDALLLLGIMDVAMYGLHRLAHHPWAYRWVHGLHHRFEAPRALTLFAMHPLEVLGFGALWLLVIALRSPTWGGMAMYLSLNVAFGILGHLGADPWPLPLRLGDWLGTAPFHGAHHRDPATNFGFYTRIWDWLFGSHDAPQYTGGR